MSKLKVYLPLLPAIFFLSIFFLYPLLYIFSVSINGINLEISNYTEFFKTALYLKVIFNTFLISISVTLCCLLLGYPVSYFLTMTSSKKRNIFLIFVILPFWTSILVRTYAWIVILQRNGILNQILQKIGIISRPLHLMYNFFGVNVAMTHILLPLMILTLYSVMKGIDRNYLLVSQNLGANRVWTFLKVFFPLSLPGVIAGSFIVFILAMGYFITPALVGGRKQTMISMLRDNQVNYLLNWGFAAALSIILLILVILILIIISKFSRLDKILGGVE